MRDYIQDDGYINVAKLLLDWRKYDSNRSQVFKSASKLNPAVCLTVLISLVFLWILGPILRTYS